MKMKRVACIMAFLGVTALSLTAIAQPTPVQHWLFDDGSGTAAANEISGGNTGAVVGATWAPGALDFAFGNHVDGGNIGLTSTDGGGTVTVSMWLNPDTLDGDIRLVGQLSGATNQAGAVGVGASLGTGAVWVWDGAGFGQLTAAGALSAGSWQHLVLVWDSGQVTAYIDGVEQMTATADFAFGADNGNFGIAARYVSQYGDGFDGQIDDVAIYDVALTESQILDLIPTPPVIFRFDCDTEGFGATNNVVLDHTLGWMVVQPAGGDPFTQAGVSIQGSDLTEFSSVIEVQDAPDTNPFQCAMFWFANGGHGRAPFTLSSGANEVRFNVPGTKESGAANWDDSITAVRLDLPDVDQTPFVNANTAFLVDYVAFSESSFFVPDPAFLNNDCDNDGLSNSFEETFGTDPLNPDSDGDGVDDGTELQHGSDPSDPNSTVEVPAMGYGAMAMLGLLLALGAIAVFRRKARLS